MSGGRLLIINDHELLITTTESSDSGLYRCNASNSQGSEIATARLTVFGKISFSVKFINMDTPKFAAIFLELIANSEDPDQTAPLGAV